jgi:predicted Kef-type K+ transport protein
LQKKDFDLAVVLSKVFLAQQQQHMQEDHEEMWNFMEIVDFECAEIIGGVLLGPTAFGRIPGFTATIFPESSRTVLNTFANIGLIFFLFLVGLELDLQSLRKYAVFSTPFILGFSSSIKSFRFVSS